MRNTNSHNCPIVWIFQEHPAVREGLDLVDEEDQFTHMLTLDDAVNDERMLGNFLMSHHSNNIWMLMQSTCELQTSDLLSDKEVL